MELNTKAFDFVEKATANYKGLDKVYFDVDKDGKGFYLAADGHRFYAARLEGQIPEGEKPQGKLSQYKQFLPREEPVFTIVVNARYLREAIPTTGEVRLAFYGAERGLEVYGTLTARGKEGERKTYALIMPCDPNYYKKPLDWRPD